MNSYLPETQSFIQEYIEKGGTEAEAQQVLNHLLELAVVMYRKGDIRHIQQAKQSELVCQVKKGSRRLKLN